MTVELLKEQNRRLRRWLRDTKHALQEAEDTIEWIGKQLNARTAGTTQEG
jgi:prefoldin subunit 5